MVQQTGYEGEPDRHNHVKGSCKGPASGQNNKSLGEADSPHRAQLSGHKSIDSLSTYATASNIQQKAMYHILSGQKKFGALVC